MRLPLAGSALLALALAGPALAEDAAELADATITVTAVRDAGYVASKTGTATRTDTPLIDVPQSVSILTRARLDDQALLSIADALRYVPGATTGQGEGHRDQPTLRGNTSTADFFVDGLRDDVQYYRDFYNIERLEILKGPNAMIFGRGGGGGVINRVSKTPGATTFVAADAAVDTFGAWRLGVDLNQPLADGISARLNAVYEDGANHRDAYDMERYAINPTLGFDLGGRGNLILSYEYAKDNRTVDRGIPSQNGRPVAGVRDAFFGDPAINNSNFEAHVATIAADYALTETLTIRHRSRYGDYDKFYANIFPATAVSSTGSFGIEAYTDGTQRQNLLSQTDLVWKTSTGSLEHTLLAGFELGRQTTRSQRAPGSFGGVSRLTVPFTTPFVAPPVSFALSRSSRTRADIAAAYIQDQISIGDHIEIIAGLRHDRFSLDFTNLVNGAVLSRTDSLWSPRFGLVLKPAENASLYASYSRSYLPQSGDQFTSLDASLAALEPEVFDNYEVGAKWDILPGLALTAALYQLDRGNTRAAGPVAGTIVLTGAQRSRGLEVELTGNITPKWQVAGGFTLQKAEIRSATSAAPAGREVPLVPRTQVSLWNRYQLTDMFGLGLGVSHQGKSFTTISNAVVLPAYVRVDAAAFVKVSETIDAQVNIENLFNKGYFPTAHNDNNISTGGPRAARFTLRTKF